MNIKTDVSLQSVIDAFPFYVMLVNEDHRILLANRAVGSDLGLDPASLAGRYCPRAIHGLDSIFPGCPLEESVAQGTAVEKELFDEKRGRWLKSCIYPAGILTGEGKRIFVHMVHDITGVKQGQEETEKANQNRAMLDTLLRMSLDDISLAETLNNMLEAILSVSWLDILPKGAIFLAEDNPDRLMLTVQKGLPPFLQEACRSIAFGKCLCGMAASSAKTVFSENLEVSHEITYEGIQSHGHYCVPLMNGQEVLGVLNVYVAPGHSRNRREEEFLGAVANVLAGVIRHKKSEQEREAVTSQLRQSQKMESIGRLAGGIAHDFNNVLTVISGYAEMLLEKTHEGDPGYKKVDSIKKSADHAATLTQQLLAFSRRQVLQPLVLDLNAVIRDQRMMLGRLIGEDIKIEMKLAKNLGQVMIDPGQMSQVIMNLVINARDAMPAGGRIIIETSNVELDETYAGLHISVIPGSYVMVAITDTGVGMDTETQAHIFEPFFTTKELGKGTGLGLAMVDGIVKQSGGSIWVYSEPGRGTTFKIYLARLVGHAEKSGKQEVRHPDAGGNETILVAEDQAEVRELVCEVLRSKGYRVLEGADGEKARALSDQHPGAVDLLLSDLVMPGIGGPELAEAIRIKRPATKILFMSGYTERAAHQRSTLKKDEAFIQKPFGPAALARKVREVLDA
jgi:signal transduction histidine kinase